MYTDSGQMMITGSAIIHTYTTLHYRHWLYWIQLNLNIGRTCAHNIETWLVLLACKYILGIGCADVVDTISKAWHILHHGSFGDRLLPSKLSIYSSRAS